MKNYHYPRSFTRDVVAMPWKDADILKDQPWLTPEERIESAKYNVKNPVIMHYILTWDMRLVEEPNSVRWGYFIARATHRFIDSTLLSDDVKVTTIFLGTSSEELFETVIVRDQESESRWKTDTLELAKLRHQAAVALASEK